MSDDCCCRPDRAFDSTSDVAAIVLAGTYQWTGSPFDEIQPRPLLPVALRPLIDYTIEWLDTAGVAQTTICANGSTAAIKNYLDSRDQLRLQLDYHADATPRGAAGCIKDAATKTTARTLIVSDGTSIPRVDIAKLLEHHRQTGAAITIVVCPVDGKEGHSQGLEPTGTYAIDRDVLELVPTTSFHDIKENLIPSAHRAGRHIELFEVPEASPRVLNAASYVAANRWMAERLAVAARESQTTAADGVTHIDAHATVWIDESATIVGPVVLGRGVRVHGSAVIVGPTVVGAGTVIGPGAALTRSVTLDNCVIGEGAVVDQCLLADHATVSPGASLSGVLRTKSERIRRSMVQRLARRRPQGAPRPFAKPAVS
jgi:NDP-sugar pyrophosphorylase family protein